MKSSIFLFILEIVFVIFLILDIVFVDIRRYSIRYY